MARRVFLGIDCGTQSTKTIVVDADTEGILGIGRSPHELVQRPDGTREQHPAWWRDALVASVREALAESGSVDVAGIGVSGQQHGLVCLDARYSPVRTAKLWNDTTTAAECGLLTERVGGLDAALVLTGNSFLTGYTAPKVLWLRRHEPDVYGATCHVCLPHDYLNLWLTGEFLTEPGDASGTAYFDVRSRRYSQPVLAAIDPDRDWASALPRVADSLSIVGRLRSDAAEALGLPAGVPVSGGGGDNMCAAIGVGAVAEGPVVVSLGTSGTAFAYSAQPAVDPRGEAAAFCDSTGGWLPLVCTLNCTVATDWVTALFGLDHEGFESALSRSPAGCSGLTFLPHLGGERTPDCPGGAGVFVGVRVGHLRDDFVRAVAEGVTFGVKYALDALRRSGVRPSEITLVGGGAASDGWAQLCADVFALPVRRQPQSEAAALGAARQARWAVDRIPVKAQAGGGHRWEPELLPALEEASQRADRLRELAVRNGL